MELELTLDQARLIADLRRRNPGATLAVHERTWGVIVEVRANGRTRRALALLAGGAVRDDERVRLAAA
ncbi:MAG: hypothetical protein ACXVFL_10580 [Solirubrobacteraceae bacterium]